MSEILQERNGNTKADFIRLLNIRFDDAYSFLRVRSVDLDIEAKSVAVQLGVPYSGDAVLTEEDKKKILSFAVEILPSEYSVTVSYRKFGVDSEIVLKLIKEYVTKFHRAYSVLLSSDNIEVDCGEKTVTVTITVVKSVADLFEKCNLTGGLKDYLDSSYDRENVIKINYTDKLIISETAKEEVPSFRDRIRQIRCLSDIRTCRTQYRKCSAASLCREALLLRVCKSFCGADLPL